MNASGNSPAPSCVRHRLELLRRIVRCGSLGVPAAMVAGPPAIIIQVLPEAGQSCRPSDWAERLCGMTSVYGQVRHLSYSPYLKPIIAGSIRCVVVDLRLEGIDPHAFRFLLGF